MSKQFLKDAIGWGIALWVIGYVLGLILFPFVQGSAIGWIIMPIGVIVTLFVLIKRVKGQSFGYYFSLAVFWTLIAVILDYFLLFKALKPEDGYYKLDVYLYYSLTFILPLAVAWVKKGREKKIAQ
ncbi:MAG: hypothetical protein ACM3KM_03600 [Acidobacteriaceae bacterium]